MLALTIGTLLAIGALVYVLFPIFAGTPAMQLRIMPSARQSANAVEQEAVIALREIEFDKATGKLSDSDYEELRARYTERALSAMRDGGALGDSTDAIEIAVSAYRARLSKCERCGPRPEPDATYCSSCGIYLPGSCSSCGVAVDAPGAAFCTSCGRQLAA